jgi:hypothetical protein
MLTELITLLHHIPNCYIAYTHEYEIPQMHNEHKHKLVIKSYFLKPRELTYNKRILACAHKHIILRVPPLTAGNVSTLCSTIHDTLVRIEYRIFCNFETCLSHNIFCAVQSN